MDFRTALIAVLAGSLLFSVSCESTEGSKSDESRTDEEASAHASASDESSQESGHRHGDRADTGAASHGEGHGRHHDFDDPEELAEEWNAEDRDAWQKPSHVVELIGIESGDTVVDLGTGTGYFLPYLSEAVGPDGRVVAVDVAEEMLEYVDSEIRPELPHDNLETRQVRRDDPGLDAESADHVLMVNTWHHVKDRVGYAEKLRKGLTPGGTFTDVDYTKETEKGPPDKIKLTPEEVVEELESAGFDAEIAEESLPEQYVVIGTKPAG